MAILGGGVGGAGNPVGGSFTGPAEALEVLGNHCYAYSGVIASAGSQTSATTTTNNFTTGNYYSKVIVAWANEQTSATASNMILITMNGAIIYQYHTGPSAGRDANENNPKNLHLIIPSYTEVEILVGTSGDPIDWTMIVAGRIYRE